MKSEIAFDQPVLLQQSPIWSRTIAWGIFGITAFTITWASIYEIDEAVSVQGKLEPQGAVTDIQAPVGGVVKQIHVLDGQKIKKGDILISLEQQTSEADIRGLTQTRVEKLKVKQALAQENYFYLSLLKNPNEPNAIALQATQLKIPDTLAYLARSRAAILEENQLYRVELNGNTAGIQLTNEQKLRLQSRQQELRSRQAVAELEVGQTQEQLNQTLGQLKNVKETLAINKDILNRYQVVARQGAFSQIQVLKQRQEVENKQAEINRLTKEIQRLQLAIAQSQEKVNNTTAGSQEDLLARITTNEKSIAEIDTQLNKVILDNQNRMREIDSQIHSIDSQIVKAQTTLKYQKILAPVNGTVFELKAKTPGFVANSSEPILKLVPNDTLIAKVFITDRDIGFVKTDAPADVRIDTYPFQRYGDIKGSVIWIGSDVLPPDQFHPYPRYPAKIRLDQQYLELNKANLPLQSGMGVNANVKLRKRSIMSIFTDFLVQKSESLKFLR